MFTKRIIPCLDVNNGRVVKGINFVNLRDAGDPVEIAAFMIRQVQMRWFFWILRRQATTEILLWIWSERSLKRCLYRSRWAVASEQSMILRHCLERVRTEISINSSAINTPRLISDAADKFGSQCVVVAIDARRRADGSGWNVYKNGGRIDTGLDAIEWAVKANELGAGEILLTSMDCDGTKDGYDIELTRLIADNVSVPVIASGGAGTKEHFYEALTEGKADAALPASLFHYKELEIMDLKNYLADKGVSVRR